MISSYVILRCIAYLWVAYLLYSKRRYDVAIIFLLLSLAAINNEYNSEILKEGLKLWFVLTTAYVWYNTLK